MDRGTANRSAAVGYVALLAMQTLVATFLPGLWLLRSLGSAVSTR